MSVYLRHALSYKYKKIVKKIEQLVSSPTASLCSDADAIQSQNERYDAFNKKINQSSFTHNRLIKSVVYEGQFYIR